MVEKPLEKNDRKSGSNVLREKRVNFFHYLRNDLNICLNDQQKEAIQANEKRILLEACPGSGKTTTLVARIAYLILCRNEIPSGILNLTFSRASARDMERRFKSLFGSLIPEMVHFSTIHSFCYHFLFFCQRKHLLVVPELIEKQYYNGKLKILRDICFKIHKEYPCDDQIEELSNNIGFVKNKLIAPEQYKSDFPDFPAIYREYQDYKSERNLMDFDDMLSLTYDVLCKNSGLYREYGVYRSVHVDEVQDTSLVQHKIIEILAAQANLFMVGDTDQSIYGFRGAEPEYIVNIERLFPETKILRLEKNYRSTGKIVQLTNRFIRQNEYRHQKNMFTDNTDGEYPVAYRVKDAQDQMKMVMQLAGGGGFDSKTAVLFRNNLSGLPVAWHLIQNGIPFHIREDYSGFFRHFIIADIFAFFQLAYDFSDMDSFLKIYYKMGAPLSKNNIQDLKEQMTEKGDIFAGLFKINLNRKHILEHLSRIRKGLKRISRCQPAKALEIMERELRYGDYLKRNAGYLRIFSTIKYFAEGTEDLDEFKMRLRTLKNGIDNYYRKSSFDGIFLLTLHGSKGLEFDRVLLIDMVEGLFPGDRSLDDLKTGNRAAYEEEVRLFYVGVTRARKEVFLLSPKTIGGQEVKPSRFVGHLLECGNLSELYEGQTVLHKKFGEGVVKSCNRGTAEIMFKKYGNRKLSVKTCLEAGLLKEK